MNKYTATVKEIGTDGSNILIKIDIFDGTRQLPCITMSWKTKTKPKDIIADIQAMIDTRPVCGHDILELNGVVVRGK